MSQDHALPAADEEAAGELNKDAVSVLMKVPWAARLARPDLTRPTCKLASKIQEWSRNDDKRVRRMVEYMNLSWNHKLK